MMNKKLSWPCWSEQSSRRIFNSIQIGIPIILLSVLATSAFAGVYKWLDKDGNVLYGDNPPQQVETKSLQIDSNDTSVRTEDLELQQRRLQQAVKEADDRIEARRTKSAAMHTEKEAELAQEQRCLEAREQLAVLQELRPVYRDEAGWFRVQWKQDTYRDKRDYLDDKTRALETERVRQEINKQCKHPVDEKAQKTARVLWIKSEKCAAARAELEFVEQPKVRAVRSTIEEKREKVKLLCQQ